MAKTITINLGDLYEKVVERAKGNVSEYIRTLVEKELEASKQ